MLQMPPKIIIDDESVFNKPQVEDLDSEKKATTEAPGYSFINKYYFVFYTKIIIILYIIEKKPQPFHLKQRKL